MYLIKTKSRMSAKNCRASRKYSISETNMVIKGQRTLDLCGPKINYYKEVEVYKGELYLRILPDWENLPMGNEAILY